MCAPIYNQLKVTLKLFLIFNLLSLAVPFRFLLLGSFIVQRCYNSEHFVFQLFYHPIIYIPIPLIKLIAQNVPSVFSMLCRIVNIAEVLDLLTLIVTSSCALLPETSKTVFIFFFN